MLNETDVAAGKSAVRIMVGASFADICGPWPRRARTGSDAHLTVFQSADFIVHWLETIGRKRAIDPVFVRVDDAQGRPLLLLPLVIERRNGLRILSFLDASASDYNSPVIFDRTPEWSAKDFGAIWRNIETRLPPFDVLRLEKMLVDIDGRRNPLLALGATPWDCSGHAVMLKGRLRTRELPNPRASRRKLRRLAEIAPTRFMFAETPAETRQVFDALMEHKKRRFEETRVPGFEQHPGLVEFYRSALAGPDLRESALLAALYCGDTPIAEQWCLKSGSSLLLLVCGNAGGKWSACSPGRLLNEHLIGWAEEQGFHRVDFGIGDEPYKAEYCDTRIELAGVVLARSARGRAALALSGCVERVRKTRLYQAARPWKWIAKRWLERGRARPPQS